MQVAYPLHDLNTKYKRLRDLGMWRSLTLWRFPFLILWPIWTVMKYKDINSIKVGTLHFLVTTHCLNWNQGLPYSSCKTDIHYLNKSYKIMYLYPWRYVLVTPAAKHDLLFWVSLRQSVKKKKKKKTITNNNNNNMVQNYLRSLSWWLEQETRFLLSPSITAQKAIDFPHISGELWGSPNHTAGTLEGKAFSRGLNPSK